MTDTELKEQLDTLFKATLIRFDQFDNRIKKIENFIKMENKIEQAPPLGLMPIREWQFARKLAIEAAILRHVIAGYEVQDGWIKELNELNEILAKS